MSRLRRGLHQELAHAGIKPPVYSGGFLFTYVLVNVGYLSYFDFTVKCLLNNRGGAYGPYHPGIFSLFFGFIYPFTDFNK